MIVPFTHILALAGAVLLLGIWCALTRRNLIMILLGIEIMLNAAALAFIGASLRWQQIEGQAVALFILAIAAAEVSVGLALIVCVYRRNLTLDPGAADRMEVPDQV